jgi:2-polyprenyl-3-methyl-5-hydroxy-6-metoxy-1,4-benzoquinol methylase
MTAALPTEDLLPDDRLWELERLYGDFEVPPISYGTVRDFADSLDNLGGLARANSDMKDLQRCWALKAVLGNVPRGGRLVEIGAGEPLVADLLARLGYEVTVIDPYDGSDQGPRQFEEFQASYPRLDFVRDRFPPERGLPAPLDCVYSISVMEHVQAESVAEVVSATFEALRPDGCAIHAIDHVVAGWGSEEHLERLEAITASSNIPVERLHDAVERLERDPETYFVSAEAHERWRGRLPYRQYPMRRIASVGLFSRGAQPDAMFPQR